MTHPTPTPDSGHSPSAPSASNAPSRRTITDPFVIRRTVAYRAAGYTQEDLAGALGGVSQAFVSALINGKARSLERERLFAHLVDRPHAELFPPHPSDAADDEVRDDAGDGGDVRVVTAAGTTR